MRARVGTDIRENMLTRRALLRAASIAPLAGCGTGVLGTPGAVRIAVSWSGSELAAFRAVLDALDLSGSVDVIPLGDEIETALTGGRSAPELVMLPQAGRVRELAEGGALRDVPESLWLDELEKPCYPGVWAELLYHDERPYGVPFKAADKSMVWFDRQSALESGVGTPALWTLDFWLDRIEFLAGTDRRLLALAAADGWALTDLFENLLYAQDPETYAALAAGGESASWEKDAVRAALHLLGSWAANPAAFAGGVGTALTMQFSDAVREVFQRRRAVMVVAPDFAEPIVRKAVAESGRNPAEVVGVMDFPGLAPAGPRPRIVGGDVLVLTPSADDRAERVLAALAAPAAPLPWINRFHGFLAPNEQTDAAYSPFLRPSAERLRDSAVFGPRDEVVFDLSDQIGALGGRNGLWRILTEFLIAVDGDRSGIGPAVNDAVLALARW
ncbi:ABC transporter substrate-binding protein [Nocardia bhagyanarayanae]|uniref:Alpha-glucoside transport system substrate-binding protein n=1 Tax=Nocardia bhagyanarayanae TaxID=1215925 RepID=A0A543FE38_9NOCA|nr:ABC transporter substrate-binding protein [Nocardia bhagyanarayanae]TQM32138.1 alpha-glucoside transport system substrate-binding protein [Nocardia bhagyanarayanae]